MTLLTTNTGEFGTLTLTKTTLGIRADITKDGAIVATSLLPVEATANIALLDKISKNTNASTTSTPLLPNTASNIYYTGTTVNTIETQLFAQNPDRRGLIIFNPGTTALYIGYSFGVTGPEGCTLMISPNSAFIMPEPIWQGAVMGIRTQADSAVIQLTDLY